MPEPKVLAAATITDSAARGFPVDPADERGRLTGKVRNSATLGATEPS